MSSVIHSIGLAVGSLLGISHPAAPPPPPPPVPPPPKLAAPIAPPAPPSPDDASTAAAMQQAAQDEAKKAQMGYFSTILTGPQGTQQQSKQTLLG